MSTTDLAGYAAKASDSMSLVNQMAEGIDLPSQPDLVEALNEELTVEEPSFKRITQLVGEDGDMKNQILKVINSPLFGLKKEVTSIQMSISLLGMRNFYSMVMTSSVKDALGFKERGMERVWLHSLQVAKLCEVIAKKSKRVSPDDAYLVGLFHDSAIPTLIKKFKGFRNFVEGAVVMGGEGGDSELFNTQHALVSAVLAHTWGLQAPLFKAIRHHHDESLKELDDTESKRLAAVLMLADYLARVAMVEDPGKVKDSNQWKSLRSEIEAELKLDIDELQEEVSGLVGLSE